MRARHQVLVLLLLISIVGAPLAALHPLGQHLFDSGRAILPEPFKDAAAIAVLMLMGASILPALSLARIVGSWLRGSAQLRALSDEGHREHTADGIEYFLLDAPQVLFFTAGIIRPRIYASTGAAEYLEPAAFRAGLLHERAHQRKRDVAWLAALAAIERAFSRFGFMRDAVRSLSLEAEFAADRDALASGAARADLFDAMVAAAQGATAGAGVGLATAGTLQRLTVLADATAKEPRPNTLAPIALLGALAVLPLLVHAAFWLGAVCF